MMIKRNNNNNGFENFNQTRSIMNNNINKLENLDNLEYLR